MAPLTLTAELKDTLVSLDGERIEQLLAWHLAEHDDADVTSFLSHLHRESLITHAEYVRAQLLASVDVTAPTRVRPRHGRPAASNDTPRTEMQPIPRRSRSPPEVSPIGKAPDEPAGTDAHPDDSPDTLVLGEARRAAAARDEFVATVVLDQPPPTVAEDEDFPRTIVLKERRRGAAGTTRDTRGEPDADAPTETTSRGAATAPPTAGTKIDQPATPAGYTLLDSIDEGGMGEILIARDNDLGRTVAFKKIHAHVAEYDGMVERFFMEAQVTAQLQHPYIVPVYQLLETDGELGYAMKLIAGKTLAQLIAEAREQMERDGRLDDEHATATLLDHFLKVCDAMHYAHRKGVLHRDLKPANIMLGAYNEVYVMDWGIARLLDGGAPGFGDVTEPLRDLRPRSDEDRTQFGDAIGTPAYMSPEQARGDLARLDHRSDQYALGLILFEMLTLTRALRGADADELERNARAGLLAPLKPLHPSLAVPRPLAAIVARATHREPEERYATTRDLADDIRHYLHNEPVAAMPDTLAQKIGRWVVRHRVATMNIAAYAVLGCLALAGLSVYRHQQAAIETEQREIHVGHMLTAVADRAGAIDVRLLRIQGILEGLAVSAAALYGHGRAETGPLYIDADFRDPARAPPDLVSSPAYGTGISVEWPVYVLAPGVAISDVEPTMRRVDALRHGFRHLMLRTRGAPPPDERSDAARSLIAHANLPVHLLQVGFAQGFVIAYPGRAGFPADYDPRTRPWYTQATRAGHTQWLAPFDDKSGRGAVLSVATPIAVDTGEAVGVAAVEMSLARVRREFLDVAQLPGIDRLLLLDAGGNVLAVSGLEEEHGARAPDTVTDAALPQSYRNDVLVDIARRRSGFLSYDDGPRELLLSYHRLGANGWYLLAEADADAVLALY